MKTIQQYINTAKLLENVIELTVKTYNLGRPASKYCCHATKSRDVLLRYQSVKQTPNVSSPSSVNNTTEKSKARLNIWHLRLIK